MINLAKKMRLNGAKAIAMKKSHKEFYEKLKGKHSIERSKYLRIQILLLCHSGLNNAEVTREAGVTLKTVKKWRSRWLSGYDSLVGLKEDEEKEYLLNFLKDNQRSGLPKKFTAAQEKAIVALACGKPRDYGIEMTDWTHEMLSKVAAAEGIVKSISSSQVGRLLKNTAVTTA